MAFSCSGTWTPGGPQRGLVKPPLAKSYTSDWRALLLCAGHAVHACSWQWCACTAPVRNLCCEVQFALCRQLGAITLAVHATCRDVYALPMIDDTMLPVEACPFTHNGPVNAFAKCVTHKGHQVMILHDLLPDPCSCFATARGHHVPLRCNPAISSALLVPHRVSS